MTPKRKAQTQSRRKAIDHELDGLLEEQQQFEDELRAAERRAMSEEETIAKVADKLQRFLAKCSKVSHATRQEATAAQYQEAGRYFRKLIAVAEWLLVAEIKRLKDD